MSHSADRLAEINEILINFSDALGYHHCTEHKVAFQNAHKALSDMTARVENAEYQKGLDVACEKIDELNLGGQFNGLLEEIKKV